MQFWRTCRKIDGEKSANFWLKTQKKSKFLFQKNAFTKNVPLYTINATMTFLPQNSSKKERKVFAKSPKKNYGVFFKKHSTSNCSSGHIEQSFDKPAAKSYTKNPKIFAESPKVNLKFFFSNKVFLKFFHWARRRHSWKNFPTTFRLSSEVFLSKSENRYNHKFFFSNLEKTCFCSKWSSGHVKRIFDNPAQNFFPNFCKILARIPKKSSLCQKFQKKCS